MQPVKLLFPACCDQLLRAFAISLLNAIQDTFDLRFPAACGKEILGDLFFGIHGYPPDVSLYFFDGVVIKDTMIEMIKNKNAVINIPIIIFFDFFIFTPYETRYLNPFIFFKINTDIILAINIIVTNEGIPTKAFID